MTTVTRCGGKPGEPGPIDYGPVPVCCGRTRPDGDCCGNPEPAPDWQPCPGCPDCRPCERCGALGVVESDDETGSVSCPTCNGTGVALPVPPNVSADALRKSRL